MKIKFVNKIVSVVLMLAMLFNSLAQPLVALAQEVIAEPTPEASTTPTVEPTPEETVTPTPVETAIPTATPEETVTPTPVETATPAPQSTPAQESTPNESAQPQAPPTENPTVTPTSTPQNEEEHGSLSAVVLENTSAASAEALLEDFDLDYSNEGSATLVTDKADYAPTDAALITGSGFTANETYKLVITSEDEPKVRFEENVTADAEGKIVFTYQLDGIYRPNYKVEAFNLSGDLIAVVTFTDSDTTFKSPTIEGANENDWLNGDRAFSSNDSYATETSESDDQSYENFGFSIPGGSTINGIEVKIEAKSSDTAGCAIQPRLWSESDNDISDRKSLELTGTDTVYTFGGSSDLWGNTWTPSDFTDANFYAEFQYDDFSSNNCSDSGTTVSVDHIQIKVYYTPANTAPVITQGTSTSVNMSMNGTPTPFSLTLNATDSDVPAQTLTWSISSGASHGTATASGTGASKSIGYTPTSNYTGTDSFVVQVSDGNGGTDTITVNVTVNQYVAPNPTLTNSCGVDIGLVIDTSTSIDSTELGQMKTAFKNFINSLIGTPTQMAVVSFDDEANLESGFTSDLASLSAASGTIDDIDGSGYTNWEDAISDTRALFPNRADKPDLIVFTTDGDPTASSAGGNDTNQPNAHLAPAITQANAAKASGIRMVTLGIGMTSAASQTRLEQISSADAFYSSANFDDLEETLQNLVNDLCGGTITATKLIDADGSGATTNDRTPAANWTFNIGGTVEVTESPNGQTDPVSKTNGTYSVVETQQAGYSLLGASCTGATNNGSLSGNTISGIQLGSDDIISCTFINKLDKTDVTVTKSDSPDPVVNGGVLTYTLTVTNLSSITANNVVVTDTLPSGFSVTNVVPSVGSCSDMTAPSIQCELGTMVGGGSATVTITGTVNTQSSSITNTAAVTTITAESNTNNNSDSEDTQITQYGHLIVQKTTLPGSDQTIFNITATGSGTITGGGSGTITDAVNYDYTVTPGTYSVSETGVSGWQQTGNTCSQVTVAAGETKYCEITNTKLGSISGYKYEDQDGSTNTTDDRNIVENWTINLWQNVSSVWSQIASTTTNSSGFYSFANLLPGIYEIREGVVSGWTNLTSNILSVTLDAGENEVSQDFLNTTLDKVTMCHATHSEGNPFVKITVSPAAAFNGHLDDDFGGTHGNHQDGEDIIPPFTFQNNSYSQNWDTVGQLIYNNDCNSDIYGSVTIIKDAQPNNSQDFAFTVAGTGLSSFSLDDDSNGTLSNTKVFSNLLPGSYSVTEGATTGWTLSNISCSDTTQNSSGSGLTANIDLALGEDITCTFTNTRDTGTITIVKDAINNDDQDFGFTTTGGLSSFTLDDDGNNNNSKSNTKVFSNINTGTYTVTENSISGWKLTDLSCDNENATTDKENRKVTFNLAKGDNITCTFENTELAKLWGLKFNDKDADGNWDLLHGEFGLGNWHIFIDGNENETFDNGEKDTYTSNFFLTRGAYEFKNLLPGEYTICEEMQTGWTNTTPICQTVNLDPGEVDHFINFGNTHYGSVKVTKYNDVNGNGEFDEEEDTLSGWTINLEDQESLVTNDEGEVLFEQVTAGTYELSENLKDGWSQTGIACYNGRKYVGETEGDDYYVEVEAGEVTECYIGNLDIDPTVEITKSNNTTGAVAAGSVITYTLSVKHNGNVSINDLVITDVLPGGFTYVTGSTTGSTTNDPTIENGMLSWNIGEIGVGETVTISYQATTANDLISGIYTNYATCRGNVGGPRVYIRIQLGEGGEETQCNVADSQVEIGNGTGYGGNLTAQVLGISTELPATGNPTLVLILALAALGTGLFLKGYNGQKKTNKTVKKTKKVVQSGAKKSKKRKNAKK